MRTGAPAGAVVLLVALQFAGLAARPTDRPPPPFKVSALQWLLEKSDYQKFDWYVERYIEHFPDTAVLHMLRGYRYFQEASGVAMRTVRAPVDRTGGIPRRYPEYLLLQSPRRTQYVVEAYDNDLIRRAVSAMHRALQSEPDRRDIWLGICHMAGQAYRPDILLDKIAWGCERFGCDSQLVSIVVDLSARYHTIEGDSSMPALLRAVMAVAPEAALRSEMSRHCLALGQPDSAGVYLERALQIDRGDSTAMETAIYLAVLRGDYAAATSLAEDKYRATAHRADLEQAVVYAMVFDTSRATALAAGTEKPDTGVSLLREFGTHLTRHHAGTPSFFGDRRPALNFALVEISRIQTRDTLSYFLHKAGLFYSTALYDSAAYYNLRLLRWQVRNKGLSYATAFNLAAEYYASGEYVMSYVRFTDLYNNAGGRRDVGVRYALGVNCETYGDRKLAARHYRYVGNRRRTRYEKYYPLRELSEKRLAELWGGASGGVLE